MCRIEQAGCAPARMQVLLRVESAQFVLVCGSTLVGQDNEVSPVEGAGIMTEIQFPAGFTWGSATSSYQIEGAWDADGKGESIWDRFAHTKGRIHDGSTGDVACDHYHLWRDDINLMRSLNLQAYRFSIAWPRVFPAGRGSINLEGVDFYNRLVDGLLEAGIAPFVTLYHWDLPQALQDQGGWAERSIADAFADYADVVSRALGDRVKNWITINEPWCVSILSHWFGEHAPGLRDPYLGLRTAHHVLLAHGKAVPAIRANSPDAEVGITLNFTAAEPGTPVPADRDASRVFDGFFNRWFVDPVYNRGYPSDMVEHYTRHGVLPDGLDFVQADDMDVIAAPTDFLGVNYYTRELSKGGGKGVLPEKDREHATLPQTEMIDWEIYPQGLYNLLCRMHFDYSVPKLYITENGASFSDGPDEKGAIHDERRLQYLRDHFTAAQRAIQAGAPVAGYFVWSLMDNFEWAWGYQQRFGMVWVDFDTQKRTVKDSALWLRDVIAANGYHAG
jgi:beta-glucosidase